jgi:hypothetical protein
MREPLRSAASCMCAAKGVRLRFRPFQALLNDKPRHSSNCNRAIGKSNGMGRQYCGRLLG